MRILVIFIFSSLLLIGCNKKDDPSNSCSFSEEHFGGSYSDIYVIGEKAAQRLRIAKNISLKTITLEMDLLNSTSVKFSILKEGSGTPAGATSLVQTTVTSSAVANTGKVTFSFATTQLDLGSYYYFLVEPIGGSIELQYNSNFPFGIDGEMWEYNGSWLSRTGYDFSFAASGECDPGVSPF